MAKNISNFSMQILGLSIILAFTHWALVRFTGVQLSRNFLFSTHLFIVVITILAYAATAWVHQRSFDRTGFAFLASVFLKMMAAFAFLYPILREESPTQVDQVLHFFAAYFIYLAFEAVKVSKLLKNNGDRS